MQLSQKPLLFKVPKTQEQSFKVQIESGREFYPIRHFHPEMQITLILKGEGTWFIGTELGYFKSGMMFIIGSNVPHVFRNETGEDAELATQSLSIYFRKDAFGNRFFDLPETHKINELMEEASKGLMVDNSHLDDASYMLHKVYGQNDFARIVAFFEFLDRLANQYTLHPISYSPFLGSMREEVNRRVNDVFNYLNSNYHQPQISLKKLSDIANLSPNAFCKYLKKHTLKTYTQLLNEIRIEHARRDLLQSDKPIHEIAWGVGYRNVSNFNRHFLRIKGESPSEYRKKRG